jgi:hypothetical protein
MRSIVAARATDNAWEARTSRFYGRCGAEAIMSNGHSMDWDGTEAQPTTRLGRIAQRAHEIYVARGGQDGKAMDDWLQAEREVDAEIDIEQNRPPA